jgi:hypothetical protein
MYVLHGIVGESNLIRALADDAEHGPVATLRAGFAMIPVTAALVEELSGSAVEWLYPAPLPPDFADTVAEWSKRGALAYVEADFFGGDGWQRAAVWRAGALVSGPTLDKEFRGPRESWPINAALAELGAPRARGLDLFEDVGFDAQRDMTDWLRHARSEAAL